MEECDNCGSQNVEIQRLTNGQIKVVCKDCGAKQITPELVPPPSDDINEYREYWR